MSSSRILNTSKHFEMPSHDLSKTMTVLIKAGGCTLSSRRVGLHKCSRTSTKVLSELLGYGCNGWRPVAYPFGTLTGDSAAREAKFSWISAPWTQAKQHFMESLMEENSWWLLASFRSHSSHVGSKVSWCGLCLSSVTSCLLLGAFLSIYYNHLIKPPRLSPHTVILVQEQQNKRITFVPIQNYDRTSDKLWFCLHEWPVGPK